MVGIIPGHLDKTELGHRGATELIVVDSMHERKYMMFEKSDAFAILPGGLGTLDETFEMLTWRKLGLHDKPIILVDIAGYWRPLLGLIDHVIIQGFAAPTDRDLYKVVSTVEELVAGGRDGAPPEDGRPARAPLKLQPRPVYQAGRGWSRSAMIRRHEPEPGTS